ncbi:peptidoglycan DD-metalloendopeptidase family protein [Burkholderia sp. Ac-20365]|jgi:lipoprotein NlpD|uniref:peptidoglycan DD-metalloendopeptidase family protein n=1 Tax=Burkholderia sp. Ac-20365 TaxID=2703897 RepID=UPI00197B6F9A|nr:peptidoglycan DD-metalloendopeptidase family protein [Burkholderia sp. Ac-20365]MBN3765755.1 peptidoglycan DD-metalloendopeptidase family protein [Burkholderia sp. Ac-20365]
MTVKRQYVVTQVLISLAAASMLGACTTYPWDTTAPPAPTYRTSGGAAATGVPAGFYRVNPGDTLQSIAGAYGQHAQDIAAWNGLTQMSPVAPGQLLRVGPPAYAQTTPVPTPAPTITPVQPAPAAPPAQVALAWPLRGPILKPFVPGKSKGIVIGGRPGDPVRAAATGRVVYAGTGIEAYGPLVIIKHDDTLITAYGQNSRLLVQEGDAVTQGQPIGEVGTDSSGVPSIQFEVRKDGKPADPLSFLPR